jgi:hypothetical protein
MKKTIIAFALVIVSLTSFSQKKDSVPQITDSTLLFSLRDINELDAVIQKQFTISEISKYQTVLAFIRKMVADRVKELQEPKKKP